MAENFTARKSTKFSQSQMPRFTLKESLVLAQALKDNFAAKSATPLLLAQAINRSPSSTDWRYLTGASAAYGLTTGGYNSDIIELTEMGKKVVMPTEEGEDKKFLVKCALAPVILKNFYEKYNGNKFPREDIVKNVLVSLGVPPERVGEALKIVNDNGRFVGILIDIKDGVYVQIKTTNNKSREEEILLAKEDLEKMPDNGFNPEETDETDVPKPKVKSSLNERRVFIAHGKNEKFIDPIKKLLAYGELESVVAIEKQSVSQPIPDKVMNDMRSCGAAIIHVDSELKLTDAEDKEQVVLSPNVLIEIGAAMALYGRRFILLVKEGVSLPSNLQGLYEVRYSGEDLGSDATIRLLEAIKDIKNHPLPTTSEQS